MSQESSIYMQRQRTQVSCGDMFALLNQNHGSEKCVLWSGSLCGGPEVCSVHPSVVHNNVVLPHCKVCAQPRVWLSSVRWAWNRSRWRERACELPRFTLEPSPNVLYLVEPYQLHWEAQGKAIYCTSASIHLSSLGFALLLIADFSTRNVHSIKQNTVVAEI